MKSIHLENVNQIAEIEIFLQRIDTEISRFLPDIKEPGLVNGLAGIGLFKAAMWNRYKTAGCQNELEDIMNRIFDSLENAADQNYSYCDGLPGIGLFFQFLTDGQAFEFDSYGVFSAFNPSIIRGMEDYLQHADYDFLYGVIGTGIYMLRTNTAGIHTENIKKIILSLKKQSFLTSEGRRLERIEDIENGFECNLGLAHGMPAAIIFLCKSIESDILPELCRHLASGLVDFIIAHQNKEDGRISEFPMIVSDHSHEYGNYSRLGWCYGDLAVASALLEYGMVMKNQRSTAVAINVFISAASRDNTNELIPIRDPFFCHGSAGIAFIFKRAYEKTHNTLFLDAYHRWLRITFNYLNADEFWLNLGRQQKDLSFLLGVTGTGLVLLSAISGESPAWAEFLLL